MLCKLFGHKWEEHQRIGITAGVLGAGTRVVEECVRCGNTRTRWIADASLGALAKKMIRKPKAKITPEICDEVDPIEVSTDDPINTTEPVKPKRTRKPKATVTEAA